MTGPPLGHASCFSSLPALQCNRQHMWEDPPPSPLPTLSSSPPPPPPGPCQPHPLPLILR